MDCVGRMWERSFESVSAPSCALLSFMSMLWSCGSVRSFLVFCIEMIESSFSITDFYHSNILEMFVEISD